MFEFIKEVRKLYKDTSKEKLDAIVVDLEKNKNNINLIFDQVTSNNLIPEYKLFELANNFESIRVNNNENANNYAKYLNDLKALTTARPKIIWLINLVHATFCLISMIPAMSVLYGILLMPAQMLLVFCQINMFINISERLKNSKSVEEDVKKTSREIKNTAISCSNFITKQIELHKQKLLEGNMDLVPMLANDLIVNYIERGVINNSRKEVLNYAVELLQYELDSIEASLKKLLELYQQKFNMKEYEEPNLVRTRNINKEASKKK